MDAYDDVFFIRPLYYVRETEREKWKLMRIEIRRILNIRLSRVRDIDMPWT